MAFLTFILMLTILSHCPISYYYYYQNESVCQVHRLPSTTHSRFPF